MLRKLIVVYNPQSSHHGAIEREVLTPVRKLQGWLVGKYEVKPTDLDDNAVELSKLLKDGDLVIAVGGDGTAAIAANGVMLSEKDVVLGVLGYGNFNDMARMLGTKRPVEYGGEYVGGVGEIIEKFEAGKITEIYPLEAKVDGKHWRFAPCYLTLGLFAESTAVFETEKVRNKLKTGKKGMVFSIWHLAKWYFKHRKEEFLPGGRVKMKIEKKAEKATREAEEHDSGEETEEVDEMAEKKERVSKRPKKGQIWQKVKRMAAGVKAKVRKLAKKAKYTAVEIEGRSKARVSDLKVQTRVKVVETRQKKQEKLEQEIANRPEISIDTELTRGKNDGEKKTDRD